MALADSFRRQVELLLRLVPGVAEEGCFALKGGTAINLFVRDMPRLSVDIDLTYLPIEDRAASLRGIEEALERVAERSQRAVQDSRIERFRTREEGKTTALQVRTPRAQVRIEVTPVLRGCVFAPALRTTGESVTSQFGFAEMPVVSFADLYAGKIVAALDRQHPRDLFDVRGLLAAEGITDELRRAFLVYLVSHDRRMSEILAPRFKDLTREFERGFAGMTTEPVSLDGLVAARGALLTQVVGQMPLAHRQFLVSLEARGEADWVGLGLAEAERLPAVQWRLHNLTLVSPARRAEMVQRLAEVRGVDASTGQ